MIFNDNIRRGYLETDPVAIAYTVSLLITLFVAVALIEGSNQRGNNT